MIITNCQVTNSSLGVFSRCVFVFVFVFVFLLFTPYPEILKVGSAESTLLLFVCPCCANFWSVYTHRMCIGAYFWLQLSLNSLGN